MPLLQLIDRGSVCYIYFNIIKAPKPPNKNNTFSIKNKINIINQSLA